jgi:pyruvate dehydrogenase E1 component
MNAEPKLPSAADADPAETAEWVEALAAVVERAGEGRGQYLLGQLESQAQQLGIVPHVLPFSAYQNTIPLERQAPHPGDVALEERVTAMLRWNALVMVVRANQAYGELGGHIATYASAAEIFETGLNHFFRGPDSPGGGDLVYFQPHSAPGMYARAFLEGRLGEAELQNFRQEVGNGAQGLSSYPHPWLMPGFWQFPTGSMGLGPINAIYQARFLRYLDHRGLAATGGRRVWGVFGDGEMDEPESIAALTLAAREKLDNLTFIINCNLQRLDGPVRGNGQIIQEFESLFTGAGWNVIKVLWGSDWDALFARDRTHALLKRFATTVDGQYQTLGANDGAYNEKHFFQLDPELRALVAHMSHAEIDALRRGGHDLRKLYAAFAAAQAHPGQPTVILAKTKKGYGMGRAGESRMTAHQEKKLDVAALLDVRNRFALPLTDAQVAALEFYRPDAATPEMQYLRARRAALGGYLPSRRERTPARSSPPAPLPVTVPPLERYATFALAAEGKEMSTTMAAVRLLGNLLKDRNLGPRLVPIVADEARTFGMANLFRQIGIYSPLGQLYEPEDSASLLAYRESRDGQLLEEGITEAGAISSWIAAGTSYSVHDLPLLPFYIFYSMFGFQRVGDLIWAAADQRTRGFLIGATAGRTTLGGEGLQHQDGSSQLVASTVPTCRAYDPAFAGELAVILDYGARQMLEDEEDVFYYVTVMNENYPQPSLPAGPDGRPAAEVMEGIVKGLYRLSPAGPGPDPGTGSGPDAGAGPASSAPVPTSPDSADFVATVWPQSVRLLGSGAILREVIAAAELLRRDWQVESEVWSATSFTELAREAREVARWNRLHPLAPERSSHLGRSLPGRAPIVAASDYVVAYPQLIAPYLEARYVTLGTDGFGRSDTRAALRRFFEVDRHQIVVAALDALRGEGALRAEIVAAAITRYRIDTEVGAPWGR